MVMAAGRGSDWSHLNEDILLLLLLLVSGRRIFLCFTIDSIIMMQAIIGLHRRYMMVYLLLLCGLCRQSFTAGTHALTLRAKARFTDIFVGGRGDRGNYLLLMSSSAPH